MGRTRKVVEFVVPQISVPLSEGEVAAKADDLARLCAEIDSLRADAAADASGARKKIRSLETRRRQLAECVRTRMALEPAQGDMFNRAAGTVDDLEEIGPSPSASPLAAQAAAINAGAPPTSDFLGPDEDWAGAGERAREEKPRTVEDRMIHAIDARADGTAPATPAAKAKNGRAAAKH